MKLTLLDLSSHFLINFTSKSSTIKGATLVPYELEVQVCLTKIYGHCSAGLACLPSQACPETGFLLILFNKRSVSIPTGIPLVANGTRGFQQKQFLFTVLIQCSQIKD